MSLQVPQGQITLSRNRQVNLGNYESESVFISATVTVAPGDSYEDTIAAADQLVKTELATRIAELQGKSKNSQVRADAAKTVAQAEKTSPTEDDDVEETTQEVATATIKEVRAALKEIKDEFGNDEYKQIMKDVAGVAAVGKIEEEFFDAIVEACEAFKAEQAEEEVEEEVEQEVEEVEDDLDEDDDDDLDGDETEYTEEDVKNALKQYNADNGKGAHKEILEKFDVTKISELQESDYAKVIAACA